MARVEAFHANLPGSYVHHNDDECPEGLAIDVRDRSLGTGELPLCAWCMRLGRGLRAGLA